MDALIIKEGATVINDGEIYTHTTVSEGEIKGKGTLWAHVSSKAIGGTIDENQVVIYWPRVLGLVLPIVFGNLFSLPKQTGEGELT